MAHVSRSKQAAVTRARTLPNCHVPAPTAETRVAPMVVVVERRRAGSPAAGEAAKTGLATASDAAREAAPSSAPRRVGGGDFSAAGSSQRVARVAQRVPRRVGLLATPCSASMAPASHEAASSQLLASAAREWSGGVVTLRSLPFDRPWHLATPYAAKPRSSSSVCCRCIRCGSSCSGGGISLAGGRGTPPHACRCMAPGVCRAVRAAPVRRRISRRRLCAHRAQSSVPRGACRSLSLRPRGH